ncbi:ycaC protein [Coprinopsis marcescibilis]|uniref:YcaC protein n=1 Tax=Coprinopsis marcescibilis TaxID=230819 RepID=A0A5C3KUQ8_COPMA|nr:ycaC protein [Coprinopsis marcescibilis]
MTPRGPKYVRLDIDKAALLIVDHQIGLLQLVRDYSPEEFRNNVFAHATLGNAFGLPTVITTSTETGPNGPVPQEILDLHPEVTVVSRSGEINAWDSPEFRAAIRATGKTQFIIAGIVTDVCTAFLALSLAEEGYEVFANDDASGAFNKRAADAANDRMRAAGIQILSMFAIAGELARDWRSPIFAEVIPIVDKYIPSGSWLFRSHAAAQAGAKAALPSGLAA